MQGLKVFGLCYRDKFLCVWRIYIRASAFLGFQNPDSTLNKTFQAFVLHSRSAVCKCLLYQPLRYNIRLNVVNRGQQSQQISYNSQFIPLFCPICVSQVQQRAQECIQALNLILKINSGEEVMNVLNSDFDWNHLKVSESW